VILRQGKYTVSRETLEVVLTALGNNWFSSNGEDEFNNHEVIAADELLQAELAAQEPGDPGGMACDSESSC